MILKYLDINLAYLPPAFREELWEGAANVTSLGAGEYRRWIYVSEEHLEAEYLEENPLPEPVIAIWRYALANECDVICFDPDGGDLPDEFEIFTDEEEEVA